jgi:hypothetical protein
MICKDNQNMIDALLRLKSREDLAVDCINKIASEQNKIASVQSTKTKKKGELADFLGLLKGHIH